jgi:hypothetical protein
MSVSASSLANSRLYELENGADEDDILSSVHKFFDAPNKDDVFCIDYVSDDKQRL